jgi:SulP family sulfate permease
MEHTAILTYELNEREMGILERLASGLTDQQIAQSLGRMEADACGRAGVGGVGEVRAVHRPALNVSLGARSRWSGMLGGVWMLVIVLLVPGLVRQVPMSVLAALMILAGIGAIDFREARSIWNTGGAARLSIVATFVATLLLSVPVAVGAGVLLTVVLYLSSSASDVRVRALVPAGGGCFSESDPPASLPSNSVTVLDVYGSLFFAGARTLLEALPNPKGATRPPVVLRLRGRTQVGATLIEVLDDYADDLAEVGGRLYLSGVDEDVSEQLRQAGKLNLEGVVHIVPARAIIGEATEQALADANAWLGSTRHDQPLAEE